MFLAFREVQDEVGISQSTVLEAEKVVHKTMTLVGSEGTGPALKGGRNGGKTCIRRGGGTVRNISRSGVTGAKAERPPMEGGSHSFLSWERA